MVSTFSDQADTLLSSVDDINNGLGPFVDVGDQLRDVYDSEYAPTDDAFHRLVPGAQQIVDLLAMTPGLLRSFDGSLKSAPGGATYACSSGDSTIPGIGSVVLGTQQLKVCK